MNSLPETDRSEKRAVILAQAVHLFNERGYHDTRLEDIAGELDTATTSISYHFRSKEALLSDAYGETCDFADTQLQRAAAKQSGLERVLALVRSFAEAQSDAIRGARPPLAVISDPQALGPEDATRVEARLSGHARQIRQFLTQGQEDGSVSVEQVPATTLFLLSVHHGLRRWLMQVRVADHARAIDALCRLLAHGLSVDRVSPLPPVPGRGPTEGDEMLFDREARNRMKREAILRLATRHFNASGFRQFSVNDVVAELGVSRGVFYYHFADKDELLRSCVERSLDQIDDALTRARAEIGTARQQLFRTLAPLFEGHFSDMDPLTRSSLLFALEEKQARMVMARHRRIMAQLGELVAEGEADGSLCAHGVEGIEHLIYATVYGAMRQRVDVFALDDMGGAHRDFHSATTYFDPLFRGLGARN